MHLVFGSKASSWEGRHAVRLTSAGLCAVAAVTLLTQASIRPSHAGQTPNANSGGWQQYKDDRNHLALSVPAGWNVRVDDHRVLVSSPDRTAFAMIENFVPQNDETAEDHVDGLPKSEADIFGHCNITEAYTLDAPAP